MDSGARREECAVEKMFYKNGVAAAYCPDVTFIATPSEERLSVLAAEGSLFKEGLMTVEETVEEQTRSLQKGKGSLSSQFFTGPTAVIDIDKPKGKAAHIAFCAVIGMVANAISGVSAISSLLNADTGAALKAAIYSIIDGLAAGLAGSVSGLGCVVALASVVTFLMTQWVEYLQSQ